MPVFGVIEKEKSAYRSVLFCSVVWCLVYSNRSTVEVIYNKAFLHYTVFIYMAKK